MQTPFPFSTAVLIDSVNLFLFLSFKTNSSTTNSISWILYLSNRRSLLILIIFESTLAQINPFFIRFWNKSWYMPFLDLIKGDKILSFLLLKFFLTKSMIFCSEYLTIFLPVTYEYGCPTLANRSLM